MKKIVMAAVSKDGVAAAVASSMRDFLLRSPRGAYTVMRTMQDCKQIVCFSSHVRRLAASAEAMFQKRSELKSLGNRILQNIRSAMALMPNRHDDLTIVVLLPTEDYCCSETIPVWVHLSPFRPPSSPSVLVEAMHASRRQFGTTKDSLWAKMREDLLKARHEGVNEVILVDDNGRILEGLSSNVFIVNGNNQVETAPISDGIVAGTIRDVLLAGCEKSNIKVVQEASRWSDRFTWKGAFLTSTSRLVLPIHEILDSVVGERSVAFDSIPDIIRKCGEITEAAILEHCHDIGEDWKDS